MVTKFQTNLNISKNCILQSCRGVRSSCSTPWLTLFFFFHQFILHFLIHSDKMTWYISNIIILVHMLHKIQPNGVLAARRPHARQCLIKPRKKCLLYYKYELRCFVCFQVGHPPQHLAFSVLSFFRSAVLPFFRPSRDFFARPNKTSLKESQYHQSLFILFSKFCFTISQF